MFIIIDGQLNKIKKKLINYFNQQKFPFSFNATEVIMFNAFIYDYENENTIFICWYLQFVLKGSVLKTPETNKKKNCC